MSDAQPEYHWKASDGGLELALSLSRSAIGSGQGVDVRLAARNRSDTELAIEPHFSLMIERDQRVVEQMGGPRASEPSPLAPGVTEELAGWHLDQDQLGATPGMVTIWVVYRPSGGREVETEHATVEVLP